MRVGIVCPYSLTVPGGVQGQVLGLARALRDLGHDTRVLAPCDGPPPDAGVTPLGDSLPTSVNGSVAPLAPDVPAQLRTIRALRDEAFDVVHLHEPLCPGPTQTALVFKSQPLVGTFHAAESNAPYRWLNPVARWMASKLDLRAAVSADARALAYESIGGDYEIVFNGVEVASIEAAEPWSDAEDGSGEAARPTILFVGRHEPRKGLAVLLEAMRDLPPQVRLWVAGDGPETVALRASVAGDPRIEWLGRISEEDKARRMRRADVFCAPSLRGESFGVVLLEAMAAGTPVVASDLSGYANVARSGRDALLVPPGDRAALAGALSQLLGDADLAKGLVASGAERAASFSMVHLAEVYLELYSRVMTAKARS